MPAAMRSTRSAHACRFSHPTQVVMAPSASMPTQRAQRMPSPKTAAATATQAGDYAQAHPGSGGYS
ncbi:hypothetical protein XAPC_3192 [Xanthomonas citri pv. punicae str. LMG 859]|nr:hypothetical protein XAPC_3192 [Xanthomonas citri pv. punicae str. LMG 859]